MAMHTNWAGMFKDEPPKNETEEEKAVRKVRYNTEGKYMYKFAAEFLNNTYFAGDAFPHFNLNMGACCHAAFFEGAKYKFEDTMWFFPSLDDLSNLKLDKTDAYYNTIIAACRYIAEQAKEDFIISMPDVSGNADALAHLRGSENLLVDLIECPDDVLKALGMMQEQYERAHKAVYDIVKKNNKGSSAIGWMHVWAPGFTAQLQCDLSVMISNAQFEKFIMPELCRQAEFLEYPVYHLDGIEQIRHLDSILSVEKIKMIQWVHVAGQPAPYKYMNELKKIQKAGRVLHLTIQPGDMPVYLENLSSKRLLLNLDALQSREAADAAIRCAEKYAAAHC
jgi:hypothetical protein